MYVCVTFRAWVISFFWPILMFLFFHAYTNIFALLKLCLFFLIGQYNHSRSYFAFLQTWLVELVTWQVWNTSLAQLIMMSVTSTIFSNTSKKKYIYIYCKTATAAGFLFSMRHFSHFSHDRIETRHSSIH